MATKKVTTDAPKKTAKKAKAADAPKGVFGPRATPEGHTGITALAEELGTTPAILRRRLRASEIQKPEGQTGWYWKDGSRELANVKKALAKAE